jgi:hypothetical protein
VTPKSNAPIPTPADGQLFEIMELMKVLESCPKGAMKEWCTEWKKKNYVHVGYEQITRKFQKYYDGKKIKPNWGQTGRPMIVDHDRLNKKVAEKLQVQVQVVGTKMIAELVSEVQNEQLLEDGFVTLGDSATSILWHAALSSSLATLVLDSGARRSTQRSLLPRANQ